VSAFLQAEDGRQVDCKVIILGFNGLYMDLPSNDAEEDAAERRKKGRFEEETATSMDVDSQETREKRDPAKDP